MKQTLNSAIILLIPAFVAAQPTFIQHTVSTAITNPIGIHATQLDGDPELEMVVGDYENGFTYTLDRSGEVWVSEQIGTVLPGIISLNSGDIDNDGDEDICGAVYLNHQVRWWGNSAGTWTEHVVDAFMLARRAELSDIDGDGDLDVASVSGIQGLSWWANSGNGDTWIQNSIVASGNYWGLAVEDMDSDGDLDIVCSDYDNGVIYLYENADLTWVPRIIAEFVDFPKDLDTADINGDGLQDVIAANNGGIGQVVWYQNQQDPYWPVEIIGIFNSANDVESADLDDDGDIDVVATSYYGNMVAWWENDGTEWIYHLLASDFTNAWNIDIADIDADGDLDISGVAFSANLIYWWEQEGVPGPVRFNLIPQITTVPSEGGLIYYDASLISDLPVSIPGLSYWTLVELPNGQVFGPLSRINFTLHPFQNIYVAALSQYVPDTAPTGLHVFYGYIGNYPVPQLLDSFYFFKEGVGTDGNRFHDSKGWTADNSSWLLNTERGVSDGAVSHFSLSEAWPNPFNVQTTMTVSLPATSELTVTLFNISGQQVWTLAQGQYPAGNHHFNIDGTTLATGVYFVNAYIPDKFNQTRKVLLIK